MFWCKIRIFHPIHQCRDWIYIRPKNRPLTQQSTLKIRQEVVASPYDCEYCDKARSMILLHRGATYSNVLSVRLQQQICKLYTEQAYIDYSTAMRCTINCLPHGGVQHAHCMCCVRGRKISKGSVWRWSLYRHVPDTKYIFLPFYSSSWWWIRDCTITFKGKKSCATHADCVTLKNLDARNSTSVHLWHTMHPNLTVTLCWDVFA